MVLFMKIPESCETSAGTHSQASPLARQVGSFGRYRNLTTAFTTFTYDDTRLSYGNDSGTCGPKNFFKVTNISHHDCLIHSDPNFVGELTAVGGMVL